MGARYSATRIRHQLAQLRTLSYERSDLLGRSDLARTVLALCNLCFHGLCHVLCICEFLFCLLDVSFDVVDSGCVRLDPVPDLHSCILDKFEYRIIALSGTSDVIAVAMLVIGIGQRAKRSLTNSGFSQGQYNRLK